MEWRTIDSRISLLRQNKIQPRTVSAQGCRQFNLKNAVKVYGMVVFSECNSRVGIDKIASTRSGAMILAGAA